MTTGRAAAALIACLGALMARPASAARATGAASPYEGELAEAAGRLRAEARKPQAASALAVLAGLDERVPAKALEQAVQAGLGPKAHPLVSAQAAWLAAHLADERGRSSGRRSTARSAGAGRPRDTPSGLWGGAGELRNGLPAGARGAGAGSA